jgi:hypothetical protein
MRALHGERVLYMDTTNGFSAARVAQLCEAQRAAAAAEAGAGGGEVGRGWWGRPDTQPWARVGVCGRSALLPHLHLWLPLRPRHTPRRTRRRRRRPPLPLPHHALQTRPCPPPLCPPPPSIGPRPAGCGRRAGQHQRCAAPQRARAAQRAGRAQHAAGRGAQAAGGGGWGRQGRRVRHATPAQIARARTVEMARRWVAAGKLHGLLFRNACAVLCCWQGSALRLSP